MAFLPGAADGTTNGTSVITVVGSPPAATQRMIRNLTVRNADTVVSQLTVTYIDGVNQRDIYVINLDPGDQVQFSATDIQVLDSTSKSLTIKLSSAKTTNDCPFVSAWSDLS